MASRSRRVAISTSPDGIAPKHLAQGPRQLSRAGRAGGNYGHRLRIGFLVISESQQFLLEAQMPLAGFR